ncbi:MAG: M18 family aminopeptidase [Desulfobulbaceae bacterium]|jgi:aspartyl aminopeptidase|nr:M18 family aminopeptidase [Desulfobulbaceae bacterium]
MENKQHNQDLFAFLQAAISPFHAVAVARRRLTEAGFTELREENSWHITPGERYVVTRRGQALIAFSVGADPAASGLRFLACHADSPALKLKPRPEIVVSLTNPPLRQLGVEVYGGALISAWFDRALSLAGRLHLLDADGSAHETLVDFREPFLIIPSLAIHFHREAGGGQAVNPQKHLPLIFSQGKAAWQDCLLTQARRERPTATEILAADLFVYDPQPPSFLGINQEFIAAARLDNLLSCHAALAALTEEAETPANFFLICASHEEVGSVSAGGAQGGFAEDVLRRIIPDHEARSRCLARSFLLSMDNAHASHPNYPESGDSAHPVAMNGGVVIKTNAKERYATDSRGAAICQMLAREAGVATQFFVMRSDLPCGSTVGPPLAAKFGLVAADVGAPTLAMHAVREMTGADDPASLTRLARRFARSSLPLINMEE